MRSRTHDERARGRRADVPFQPHRALSWANTPRLFLIFQRRLCLELDFYTTHTLTSRPHDSHLYAPPHSAADAQSSTRM